MINVVKLFLNKNIFEREFVKEILQENRSFLYAIITAFLSIVLFSFLFSKTPFKSIHSFIFGGFSSIYSFGNMLNIASTYIFAALGISIVFNIGFFNLGGDGQIYLGGFITAIFLTLFSTINSILGFFLVLAISAFCGGALCLLSGILKIKLKMNELISSYIISRIIILVINYFISSPFYDKSSNLITTKTIESHFFLPKILNPSSLNISIIFAVLFSIALYIYLKRSRFGYETIISGKNNEFAKYGGININVYILISAFLSGALSAIAGSFMVLGTYHAAVKEFSLGIGFSAITVSLIAKNNPLTIIFSSVFFALVESGARYASIKSDISVDTALVVSSVIFIIITAEIFSHSKKHKHKKNNIETGK